MAKAKQEDNNKYVTQLKLSTESMGAFSDAMKSYIMYTLAQNITGTKESGVGYYYDHKGSITFLR